MSDVRALRIDAHQHYWRVDRGDYPWLTPALAPLYRDFAPADLEPQLLAHGIDGTVLVQAAPTVEETRFLLDLARACPRIRAVVGWADLLHPEAAAQIAGLARDPLLRGLRPMLQDLPDARWIADPRLDPAIVAMQRAGLRFDALVRSQHLPALHDFAARHPQLPMVVDHLAKPRGDRSDFQDWRTQLARLARQPQVCCKLSGLVTEAGDGWTPEGLRPWVETVIELFGAQRVIWGSDWPVLLMAGDYARWVAACEHLLADLPAAQRRAIWGENALRFYGIQ